MKGTKQKDLSKVNGIKNEIIWDETNLRKECFRDLYGNESYMVKSIIKTNAINV